MTFKYAMHSGPHPTLVVACPTCEAPAGHFCIRDGEAADRPHFHRRLAAGTAEGWYQARRQRRDGSEKIGIVHYLTGRKALCGYVPNASTEMVRIPLDSNDRSCETCIVRSDPYDDNPPYA